MANENRPQEAASESATTTGTLADLTSDHALFSLGDQHGYMRGWRANAEDLAREWLHNDARHWTDMAVELASRVGPHWADAIREQAEGAA